MKGSVMFPPRSGADIAGYDLEEMVDGYLDWRGNIDVVPGPNRSDGYRWGWMNARRDRAGADDGYDGVRADYLRNHKGPGRDLAWACTGDRI